MDGRIVIVNSKRYGLHSPAWYVDYLQHSFSPIVVTLRNERVPNKEKIEWHSECFTSVLCLNSPSPHRIHMMQHQRQSGSPTWDNLPSTALVNIFMKSSLKDRIYNLPLVCKSWANSSRHPHCWASFSVDPPVDAFVKSSAAFLDPFDGRRSSDPQIGIFGLQSLISKAGGGSALTSLYFFPFLTSLDGPSNDDTLLELIATFCPNLKHLSFHGSFNASEQVLLEVVRSCPNLDLVDFSDSPYFIPAILQEMEIHCPNIRGIRRNGFVQPFISSTLIECFPGLKLLNLSDSSIGDRDLLTLVTGKSRLEYLDITRCQSLMLYMHIIKGAHRRIAEIHYD